MRERGEMRILERERAGGRERESESRNVYSREGGKEIEIMSASEGV